MPGARGRNGRRSGRHKGNGARIPGGHAAPGAAGHEDGDKSENDLFLISEGVHPQSSSLCAPRLRTCRWDRGDWKASLWKKLRILRRSIHAKKGLVSVLVHAQRAFHTPCSAHHPNGTQIDNRNGQKGVLGTRIIHAMVGETVLEGGDEHFSPKWHGFLRGTKERRHGLPCPWRRRRRHGYFHGPSTRP